MYVTVRGNNAIAAFPEDAKGNVAPALTIAGPATLLGSPVTLAVAKSGNIYAANEDGSEILTFAKGASGNVAPQILGGSHLPLTATRGVAVDAAGRIYVSDYRANKIFVFAPNASGNARPIRTIGGNKTLLTAAAGMAFDGKGNLYVANSSDSTNPIVEFSKSADRQRDADRDDRGQRDRIVRHVQRQRRQERTHHRRELERGRHLRARRARQCDAGRHHRWDAHGAVGDLVDRRRREGQHLRHELRSCERKLRHPRVRSEVERQRPPAPHARRHHDGAERAVLSVVPTDVVAPELR